MFIGLFTMANLSGKTHYRDGGGDWLEVSDSNIDVSAIQASKIAGKLSVSESVKHRSLIL